MPPCNNRWVLCSVGDDLTSLHMQVLFPRVEHMFPTSRLPGGMEACTLLFSRRWVLSHTTHTEYPDKLYTIFI